MAERAAEFAYTYRESVRWLLDHTAETGEYPIARDVVFDHVGRMKKAGWDALKILEKCARFDIYHIQGHLQVPLVQIIYFDHPIVSELPDHLVRGALYRMAAVYAAQNRADQFADSLAPEKEYRPSSVYGRNIRAMEQFMDRLTAQVTAPVGRQRQ
jgi:hypothetical protein